MHHIQKSIILSLARTSPLRFTDLQPPRIPNNTFTYHLKKLIDSEYVELTTGGYVATRKALKLVVFGVNTIKPPSTPQTITLLYIENREGEVLLLNRNRKPFQGWYGIPGGLIHLGETLEQAAERELTEKVAITANGKLKAAGVLDLRYMEEETQDIFLHVIGFVYSYKFPGDSQELSDKITRYGQLTWSRLDGDNILPEVYIIKKVASAGKLSHISVDLNEPSHLPVFSGEALPSTEANPSNTQVQRRRNLSDFEAFSEL